MVTQLLELLQFEFRDHDTPPCLTRPDQGCIHELQCRTLAEGMRNDLGAPTLFAKQALQQICRTRGAPMCASKIIVPAIEEPVVIVRILTHLGLPARAPPC